MGPQGRLGHAVGKAEVVFHALRGGYAIDLASRIGARGSLLEHGLRPLTGIAFHGEITADLGSRFVDRAPPIHIEKTAGLVKG